MEEYLETRAWKQDWILELKAELSTMKDGWPIIEAADGGRICAAIMFKDWSPASDCLATIRSLTRDTGSQEEFIIADAAWRAEIARIKNSNPIPDTWSAARQVNAVASFVSVCGSAI
jgi:hypothetical protein